MAKSPRTTNVSKTNRAAAMESTSLSPKNKKDSVVAEIMEIKQGDVEFNILGTSPLIVHRYPFKAWMEMLLPSRKENLASLEQTMKHKPFEEYRESFYLNRDKNRPTLFHLPNGMFAGCLAQAGVDVPGAARATLQRLTRVPTVQIDLFGIPQIFCAMARNSGMNRTPDVRTRGIFPAWACKVTVRYCRPQLTERNISNLMGAAGMIVGVGDWRGERGGPFGAFQPVGDNHPEFKAILKQGRKLQEQAYNDPQYFDDDTEKLLTWFQEEVKRREQAGEDEMPRRRRGRPQKGNGRARPETAVHVMSGTDGDENYLGTE